METCMTLGMLTPSRRKARRSRPRLLQSQCRYVRALLREIITTRTFEDRLETLAHVREAGIKVCAGGILGMGETDDDRISMLVTLANLPAPPESVPINMLIPIPGSLLADAAPVDPIDFVRTIALARILMPRSHVRLSAGRTEMSDEMQALCFFAGANSIFAGDTLLTADNPGDERRLAVRPPWDRCDELGGLGKVAERPRRVVRGFALKLSPTRPTNTLIGASWFETRVDALLTIRDRDLILRA